MFQYANETHVAPVYQGKDVAGDLHIHPLFDENV